MAVHLPEPRPGDHPQPDPQRMIAAALRAQASVAGRPAPSAEPAEPAAPRRVALGWALLLALLIGVALGAGLALLSLLAPGVLPPIG